VSASLDPGDALIYLGSVRHCGRANNTLTPRTRLILSYSLGWLKQYENAFLSYSPQVARTFSRELLDLLGYRIHRPNLGHYEGQDPSVALSEHSLGHEMADALPPAIAQELAAHYRI
jgi:ectoine hydroxylase-related dioxygenase (phytanoyl-CoA dioxygenase family)